MDIIKRIPEQTALAILSESFEKNDKLALAEWNKNLDLDKIVAGEHSGQLSKYRRESPAELNRLLKKMLYEFAHSFSISNNLTSEQIYEIVAELQVTYWYMSLEDISLFLQQIKRGEYGVIYSLDTNKLLSWLRQYDEKRLQLIHQKRERENEAYADNYARGSADMKRAIGDIRTKMDIEKGRQAAAANKKKK